MNRSIAAVRANSREHRASILVAALSSAFGVVLLAATNVLTAYIDHDQIGQHRTVQLSLTIVSAVFIVVAVYVGSLVTTNTFATIIAGRTRTIALLRLIGSSARAQRRAVAGEGLVVGATGAVAGAAIGVALAFIAVRLLVALGAMPDLAYPIVSIELVAPVVVVVLTTWLASWIGSRRVLQVTPVQALGVAVEPAVEKLSARPARNAISFSLIGVGVVILTAGVLVGRSTPLGMLVALPGGVLSFTGLVLAAHLFMPRILSLIGMLLGRSAAARLARANAIRHPERSTRTTIGLVIGVTLITMFVVAAQTWQTMIGIAQTKQPELYAGASQVITVVLVVFSALIGVSAVIAAVGVVNNLSLSVLQRTRELGLLRALGFSARQVRAMILAESAQVALAAVVTGLALGTVYGWVGAQSLLGALPGGGGIIAPVVPLPLLITAVGGAAVFAVVAAIAPTRRATAVSPVAALAID